MKKGVSFIFLCLILTFFIIIDDGEGAMSEAQLKATVKLVRNLCQPKFKATDEDIEKMHRGDWNIDRTAMCYLHCGMIRNGLITKDNQLYYDHAVSLAKKSLPDSRKAATLASIEACKDSAVGESDECVAAYKMSKCFYESNPENYFFP